MSDQQQLVTIDGRDYSLDSLSDNAKAQFTSLRIVDDEIRRIEQKLAIYRTARSAYARVLKGELDKIEQSSH